MELLSLLSLQGSLLLLMSTGAWLKRRRIIDEAGKRCLTDLCVNAVIPCNIFRSFLMDFHWELFRSCLLLLVSAVLLQLICLLLNRWMFNRCSPQRKKVLQYCTIVPMSGFLGNPIAEGIYDQLGVLYTSIFLIPMRIVMWSAGTTYFVAGGDGDRKALLKKIATHPCLVSVYLGLFFFVTQLPLPAFVTETIRYISSCNSALTMFLVGTILADVRLRSIFNRLTAAFSLLRLVLLPLAALGLGVALGLERVSLGVSVLMTGMPAGATAAIFAARYHSDAPFATQCVVASTLLSMVTLPLWCWLASGI